MSYETVLTNQEGPVLELVLNRPESRNAINRQMEHEIGDVLRRAEKDDSVRAVTLEGSGAMFSAGHDLKEMKDSVDNNYELIDDVLLDAWNFRKPLISAVHEFCGPYAIAYLCCCDVNLAASGTRFSFEQLRLGSIAPHGPWMPMYFQFPMSVLEKFWLFGGWMDADDALRLNFVQRVVPRDELKPELQAWARQAAAIPTSRFVAAKTSMRRVYEMLGLSWMQHFRLQANVRSDENLDFYRNLETKGMREAVRIRDSQFDPGVSKI